ARLGRRRPRRRPGQARDGSVLLRAVAPSRARLGTCGDRRRGAAPAGRSSVAHGLIDVLDALALLASIPSPDSNSIGPFRAYGLMIGLGVLAAIEITARRWRARGGDPNDIWSI